LLCHRKVERVTVVVLDGAGVGALSDAWRYGDEGSDTLGNLARRVGGLRLPNLQRLGLGCLHRILGVPCGQRPAGCYGRMAEASVGKDSTVGHWEIAGIITTRPFPTYPNGFPADLIEEFARRIGRKVLGNKVASGTIIIEELGARHLSTGYPIVYTSADSVFQVAAHEEVIPEEELYHMCHVARGLLRGEHAVARVIARPFVGAPGSFVRTPRRKDFGLEPPGLTVFDLASAHGLHVVGIGKIGDLFAHRGLTQEIGASGNLAVVRALLECLRERRAGIVFATLVDFDMLYGHRNDAAGFAAALAEFDNFLPAILSELGDGDVLFITADHGCDPTTASTDHSREYVPLICFGSSIGAGVALGTRATFADLGATAADLLSLDCPAAGESFASQLLAGSF